SPSPSLGHGFERDRAGFMQARVNVVVLDSSQMMVGAGLSIPMGEGFGCVDSGGDGVGLSVVRRVGGGSKGINVGCYWFVEFAGYRGCLFCLDVFESVSNDG
ncbi:hypothetical protein Droror1_Dr00020025, partial [Drosera rotundifolia]